MDTPSSFVSDEEYRADKNKRKGLAPEFNFRYLWLHFLLHELSVQIYMELTVERHVVPQNGE